MQEAAFYNSSLVTREIGLKIVGHGTLRTICVSFVDGRRASLLKI